MDANLTIDCKRTLAEKRRELTSRTPTGEIHLEVSVLRVQKPGRASDIDTIASPNGGDAKGVA
jgi:hypothetical protein